MYRVLTMDLVLSRCPTEAEGGRGHFLFDPLSVEPDLCEIALDTGYVCTQVLMYSCVLMYPCTLVLIYY